MTPEKIIKFAKICGGKWAYDGETEHWHCITEKNYQIILNPINELKLMAFDWMEKVKYRIDIIKNCHGKYVSSITGVSRVVIKWQGEGDNLLEAIINLALEVEQ